MVPEGSRKIVTIGGLFRFATVTDILLILLGSIFAALEGAGPAVMALVFGGMTNTLVTAVKFGFAPETLTSNETTTATTTPTITTTTATTLAINQSVAPTEGPTLTAAEFEANLTVFSLFYVAIGVCVYLASLIQITCWQTACERQVHRIRMAFFSSVLRQELSWFDQNQAGELSAKFNDDVERIRDGIGEQFSSVIKYSSSFLSGFVVGFIVSWRLTLVILAATPLLAIFSAYLGRMLATSTMREQEKYAKAGAIAEEVLTTVRTVFALGGQRSEIKKYKTRLDESKRMAYWKYFRLSLVLAASMFVLYATYGLALFVAANLIADGLISPGSAMTVIMSVMMGASALGNIIPPMQTVVMATSSASLVFAIVDSVPRIDASAERGLKLSKVTANIKFEHVTFTYPTRGSVPVIRDLNFELHQGQTVAICGRTGSGKSTIINLLLRFYDPDSGAIYLDNCNLCDLNVAWLRSLIGIVEQEPALFDCSIYENIALGASSDADKTYPRIIEAAKLANAHEFIVNLPDGYNTRCGDRGVQLSGGQKQRISIARALLCDPKILLLDEATSALDSENEFMVQTALNRARQGRTTVIIAHRLSTIRDADLICVMDSGVIVEMGRHEELIARKGEYYSLVTNQVFNDDDKDGSQGSDRNGAGQQANVDLDSDSDKDQAGRVASAATDFGDDDTEGYDESQSAAGYVSEATQLISNTITLTSSSRRQRISTASRQSTSDLEGSLRFSRSFQSASSASARVRQIQAATSASSASSKKRRPIDRLAQFTTPYETINRPLKNLLEFQNGVQEPANPVTYRDVLRLVRPELGWLAAATFAAIIVGALLPTFAIFYGQIFATFTKTGDELLSSGAFWALMFVVLALANFVATFFRIILMTVAIEMAMARIRSECFKNILRQHVGWFDVPNNAPQRLTTRLASDVPQVKAVLNARLSTFISGLATIAAALLVAFYLGWQLAIVLTFALPILLYVGFLQMRMSRGDRSLQVRRMENASRLATEAIEHVKLVQSINQERYFIEKFNHELRSPLKESLAAARRFGFVYGLSQSVIYFVYGGAFRWSAWLMAREILDPINVFRVFFAIAFTAVAVGQWGGLGGDLSRADQAIAMLIKLLDTRPAIDNLARKGVLPRLKGSVVFQDVHFRYPARADMPVLQGLNLSVKAGETLALVGPSGNGKSTIAALLLRFYDPDSGVVRIDDHDIRCINLNHLRLNVGLVSQEPVLFKASIRDNILYGLDKARYSQAQVEKVAKTANIHDFIESLPDKYDTQVGDRGNQLSGGQKQRIAIARTIIRDPIVLILDEATSALDSESEALVNQALEKASRGKTCIKIAHRLSTVRDADQIAVIEKGQIIEQGTHEQLMSLGKDGHYFRLMQKQEISS